MGTDSNHQVVLRELDNVTPSVITAIRKDVPKHQKKESYYHSVMVWHIPIYKKRKKEDLENYMLICFAVSPGKMVD